MSRPKLEKGPRICKRGHSWDSRTDNCCKTCVKNYMSEYLPKYNALPEAKKIRQKYRKSAKYLKWLEGYKRTSKSRAEDFLSCSRRQAKLHGGLACSATLEEVIAEYEKGKCSFCGAPDTFGIPDRKGFHMDHCHITGILRGLLCPKHNGMLKNIPEMQALISWALKAVSKRKAA